MSRTNRTIQNLQSHPVRTGIFAILAVIMLGGLLGHAFGFDAPTSADAQIVVTAPAPPAPPPPPPPPPAPVVPVVPVPPSPPAPATPGHGHDGSGGQDGDIVVTGPSDSSGGDIVVVGSNPTYTSPCCSLPPSQTTPPTYTSPCCTVPPEVPIISPVIPPPVTPPVVPPVMPPSAKGCIALTASKTSISSGEAVVLTWKVKNDKPVTITNTTDNTVVTTSQNLTGTVTVNPTKQTTYHASVPSDKNNPNCTVTVKIPTTPPPPPSSSCIALTANKSSITSGDAVVLAFQAKNDKPVTITNVTDNKVVTTSQNTTGTVTVNPTKTTTYHASVPSDKNNPNCTVTVKIVPPSSNSSCILLSADKTHIDSEEDVVLTWKVKNDKPVTVTNETDGKVVTVSNDQSGSVTVNPDEDTTYHASVPSDKDNPNCTVSVDIEEDHGGGHHSSHHSSSSKPDVFFTSTTREAPPLSSVYLSQIPYTGLDLGPVGTVLYWAMLVIWSLAVAYLVLFGALPFMRRKLAAFGSNVSEALNGQPALLPAHAGAAYAMPAASIPAYRPQNVHQAVHTAAVGVAAQAVERSAPAARPAPRMEMNGDSFKKFATNGALTIDDIVKGLSRESGMAISAEPAHEEAPAAAKQEAPQEAPRAAAPAREQAPVSPDIIGFIRSILDGERDAVFSTIRRLNQAGHDAEEFVSHAILALDDAYKARIDGTPVHEDVKEATDHCATPFLEKLVSALTTAVDGSYSMGVTGIKLALTRALAVAQG